MYVTNNGEINRGKLAAHIAIGIIVVAIILNSFTVIDSGQTGVVVKFGAVSDTVLQEGLHLKIPFATQVIKIDNRVARIDVESGSASKDLQSVDATVAVNYRVDRTRSADIYKNVNQNYEDVIIEPAIQECIKSTISQYNAEDLIIERQDVSNTMKDKLSEKVQNYGLVVENFSIIDLSFSQEFDEAIEAKQTAHQLALKAEQDLIRIKTEAEQDIAKAEAEAEALRIKREQTTAEMIQMEWIKKWDGKLPTYTGDGMSLYIPAEIKDSQSEGNQDIGEKAEE